MKFLMICGSLRQRSFNRGLILAAMELVPDGVSVEIAPAVRMPLYDNDEFRAGRVPDIAEYLADAIRAADAVVIASPEYNHSVAAPLKNAIDWLSELSPQPFKGKNVAIFSAAPGIMGGSRGQYHLRQILNSLEARVLSKPEVFVTLASTKFDADVRLTDEPARALIATQMKALASLAAPIQN